MQESAHATDTAIASCRLDVLWRVNFESHIAAMAAAEMSGHDEVFLQTAI